LHLFVVGCIGDRKFWQKDSINVVFCKPCSGSGGFSSDKNISMFLSHLGTTIIANVHPFSGCFCEPDSVAENDFQTYATNS
jgi:hypothetical protein